MLRRLARTLTAIDIGIVTGLKNILFKVPRRLAEIADATGESRQIRRIASGELGDVSDLMPCPDGTHVAVSSRDGRLFIVTVESGEVLELAAKLPAHASGTVATASHPFHGVSMAIAVANVDVRRGTPMARSTR